MITNNQIQLKNHIELLSKSSSNQSGQGVIIQSYCQGVITQSPVKFGIASLQDLETKINTGLNQAKSNGKHYLNVIQPSIISNISNISSYYNLLKVIPKVVPAGSSVDAWLNALRSIQQQTEKYQVISFDTAKDISTFRDNLNKDVTHFKDLNQQLNTKVNGDNGTLEKLEEQIRSFDGKIAGAIAGIVASAVAIGGGVFLIAVGTIGSFVTAGTSLKIAAAGGLVVAAGVSGAAAASIVLANLVNAQQEVINKKENLKAEVLALATVTTEYSNLYSQANHASQAANDMANAWNFLGEDLKGLSESLQEGIMSTDVVRDLFLAAANEQLPTVKESIKILKNQMTGVNVRVAPANQSLVDFAKNLAESGRAN
ncbi:MAG: HBL/NHE enterotoxin family protein [Bacteroidota bacterium]